MAAGCIWLGTAESVEFWHLLNSTFHCSGRGSEVLLVMTSGMSVAEVYESVYRYDILQTEVLRQKQKDKPELQTVPVYPDRDGVLEDFYFSLIYMLVMVGCDNEYVFPTYSKEAIKTKEGKSKSKGSTLWKSHFNGLLEELEELTVPINQALRSHCNRRGS